MHIFVPTFAAGEEVEITILPKARTNGIDAKIQQIEKAARDPLFLADLKEVNSDFRFLDTQYWVAA